ncbi:MAG: RNA methyltransferase, partial [Clostridia bacterium]|nr:RNA methyltransferase [Clostridia bacterium]
QFITSVKNQKIQFVKKLHDKSFRKSEGLFIVEGENIIKDMPSSIPVADIFVEKDKTSEFSYILERYNEDIITFVDEKVMKSMSETVTPSGILAVVKKRQANKELNGNVVILDGISDPGNFGTIIRTCVACGIEDIVAIDCVDYTSGKVVRSSMGGVFGVNIVESSREEALNFAKNHTFYALDMGGENIYDMSTPKTPYALIVGSESRGLSKEFRDKSNVIALPMSGKMESLNAAVSLSVALYRFAYGK